MKGWIKETAEKLELAEAEQQERLKLQMVKLQAVRDGGIAVFAALRDSLKADYEEFNNTFPDVNRRLGRLTPIGEAELEIARAYSPEFYLKVALKYDPTRITYEIRVPDPQTMIFGSASGEFRLILDGGEVKMVAANSQPLSPEAASEFLLRPAIYGLGSVFAS